MIGAGTIAPELALLRDLATNVGRRSVRLGLTDELAASVTRDADGIAHVTGDLERLVIGAVERSPRRDSLQYLPPTPAERAALVSGWAALRSGDVANAARLVEPTGMSVVRVTDVPGGGAVHHALMEAQPDPARLRGLGVFLHRSDARAGAIHVQIPHPWDDIATETIGARLYRASGGETLALAGASRSTVPDKVSDAAHSRETLFHSLADATAVRGERQVQLHGFNRQKHTSYGDAVVSTGSEPSDSARRLHAAMRDGGFDARLSGHDRPYINLAGRKNVQGIDARERGADWLHVEIGDSLRDDPATRQRVVEALTRGSARP